MTAVRGGGPADVDGAVELWRAALAARGVRPPAAQVAGVRARLADPAAVVVVATGDEVEGVALGTVDGGALHLEQLVVAPALRRQGLGTALLEALADAAWPRGARRLVCAPPADAGDRAFLVAAGLEEAEDGLVADLDPPVREVVVHTQPVRLGQLLKLAGLVDTGSQAKALLEAGGVEVDGEVETRRGRQLEPGSVVVAREQAVRLAVPPP